MMPLMPAVDFLDTDQMPWQPDPKIPGKFVKILNSDEKTGAYTCISRTVPHESRFDGHVRPHYHMVDDELLCLSGRFFLDHPEPLQFLSYVFCPAGQVHGFTRKIDSEFTVLGRFSGHVTWTYPDTILQGEPYPFDGRKLDRPYSSVISPSQADWERLADDSGRVIAEKLLLGEDPISGEASSLVRLMPGWKGAALASPGRQYHELFVLGGTIGRHDGPSLRERCYGYWRGPEIEGDFASPDGALIYICEGPRPA